MAMAQAQLSPEKLLSRAAKAWARKGNWDETYREAYKYGLPQRDLYSQAKPGQPKGNEVFDSTASTATGRFANRMQKNFTPPFRKWGQLEPGPLVPKEKKDALAKQLEDVTERLFAIIDISNFNTAINEFYLDLAAGTACLFIEEGDDEDPVNFIAVPQIQVALEEGPHGRVNSVFRKHKLAVRLIVETWPGAVLPEVLREKLVDAPDTEVEFHEVTVYDATTKTHIYDVIYPDTKSSILPKQRIYQDNPWIVTRWIKAANEVYGRGPLLNALPDIKTLNKLIELILKNASLSIVGAYTAVDDGVLNPNMVRMVPGAVIPVARNGGPSGPSLMPIPRTGNFDVAQLERDDLRMGIKKQLYDQTLPPDVGPVRSPTEILERAKELADDIGAAFGRLMAELIQPLIQRVLGIMARKGLIDVPIKITGSLVKVKITSPMALLQNIEEVKAVFDWLQMISTMGPEMMMLGAKVEDIPAWAARKLGVPEELIRSEQERTTMQEQTAQMMAQNAQANNPTAATAMAGPAQPTGAPA